MSMLVRSTTLNINTGTSLILNTSSSLKLKFIILSSLVFRIAWFVSTYFSFVLWCCLVPKSCLTLLRPTKLLCLWDFPGKNAGMGCHFLLQGIFRTEGSNPCILNWQADFYHWATREDHLISLGQFN